MIVVHYSSPLAPQLSTLVYEYSKISLAELKAKAELLHRRDNKYILSPHKVFDFLQAAQADFDILEINGLRKFAYYSQYFDSLDFRTHDDHNKGRRQRIKVRHRNYVDSALHFFEVKVKGFRKMTQKYRCPIDPQDLLVGQQLHPKLQKFCQKTLAAHDYSPWEYGFHPSIIVYYQRLTLVAKAGSERITMDNGIAFASHKKQPPQKLNDDRWVVEIKSAMGRTAMDRWMLCHGQRPRSKCSKYCLGINLLKRQGVNNRFSPVLRRYF